MPPKHPKDPHPDTRGGAVIVLWSERKRRKNAFWGERYHATLVEGTAYLWRCLRYIDLNMVRAGKVQHPRQWQWCGYDELTGTRQRYRIIDQERLLALTGFPSMADFASFHARRIDERLSQDTQVREAYWADAVAIGDQAFVEATEQTVPYRQSLDYQQVTGAEEGGVWVVRESSATYEPNQARKSLV